MVDWLTINFIGRKRDAVSEGPGSDDASGNSEFYSVNKLIPIPIVLSCIFLLFFPGYKMRIALARLLKNRRKEKSVVDMSETDFTRIESAFRRILAEDTEGGMDEYLSALRQQNMWKYPVGSYLVLMRGNQGECRR